MNMQNPITFKNTITDVNKVVSWLQSKNETRNFCDIPPGCLLGPVFLRLQTNRIETSMNLTSLSQFNAASIVLWMKRV